jgi:UDPglucose--hexose-1-phosphate uridylyltransferase
MFKQAFTKGDGRTLVLYARAAPPQVECLPGLRTEGPPPNSHLRWHPLRAEWVAYATHRQHRTFLPPADWNPLAASCDPARPTEVPAGTWDVAVFTNLFPTFTPHAHDAPRLAIPTAEGRGVCEVVVFTQNPAASLGRLPLWHVELVIDVWADRYVELSARDDVAYVFPFENRGQEVGVTLHHPHGQIYGYPFIPPVPAQELHQQRVHVDRHGRGLLEDFVQRELAEAVRIIYAGPHVAAFVPICARYPYEVWIAPMRNATSFADLAAPERVDFATALKTVLLKFDGLWNRPFPYILAVHQAPSDGSPHTEAHLHAELYPALRLPDRLKFLAGSEIGAGVFTADTLPEEKARELQAVTVNVNE